MNNLKIFVKKLAVKMHCCSFLVKSLNNRLICEQAQLRQRLRLGLYTNYFEQIKSENFHYWVKVNLWR